MNESVPWDSADRRAVLLMDTENLFHPNTIWPEQERSPDQHQPRIPPEQHSRETGELFDVLLRWFDENRIRREFQPVWSFGKKYDPSVRVLRGRLSASGVMHVNVGDGKNVADFALAGRMLTEMQFPPNDTFVIATGDSGIIGYAVHAWKELRKAARANGKPPRREPWITILMTREQKGQKRKFDEDGDFEGLGYGEITRIRSEMRASKTAESMRAIAAAAQADSAGAAGDAEASDAGDAEVSLPPAADILSVLSRPQYLLPVPHAGFGEAWSTAATGQVDGLHAYGDNVTLDVLARFVMRATVDFPRKSYSEADWATIGRVVALREALTIVAPDFELLDEVRRVVSTSDSQADRLVWAIALQPLLPEHPNDQ